MIPKTIHQIWEGETLSELYELFGKTWKEQHPDWRYEFWNGERMATFIKDHYPLLANFYFEFPYNIQRWDVIRYLILYQIGGMYIDFDYECIDSVDRYIDGNNKCYFSMEPEDHCVNFFGCDTFSNALMVSCPGHPFFKKIIDHIFFESKYVYTNNKIHDVHATTGPVMLRELYKNYPFKDEIVLWPAELASAWSKSDVENFIKGTAEDLLEKKLEKAFAVHYFFSSWAKNNK